MKDLGASGKKVINELLAALKDENFSVKLTAISALKDLGASGKEVINELLAALEDENFSVSENARKLLVIIGTKHVKMAFLEQLKRVTQKAVGMQ